MANLNEMSDKLRAMFERKHGTEPTSQPAGKGKTGATKKAKAAEKEHDGYSDHRGSGDYGGGE